MRLPATIGVTEFDKMHDDVASWRDVVARIAAEHSRAPVTPATEGTVLVALVGRELVVKLYPPFLRDHCEFEAAVLKRLHGRLCVPTPALAARGERDGWPYLVITQLAGEALTRAWPSLAEARKCEWLATIGRLAAEVHALAPGRIDRLAPDWDAFVEGQRAGCKRRQALTGLPLHLLEQVESFVAGPVPAGSRVILTGEYTPMNLLHEGEGLAGMFDFGDGLVGPREYDWLGPLCFLAAGQARRCDAFFAGYGATLGPDWRSGLMRLLLLHRYSNLRAQVAFPGWERADGFEALAHLIWP